VVLNEESVKVGVDIDVGENEGGNDEPGIVPSELDENGGGTGVGVGVGVGVVGVESSWLKDISSTRLMGSIETHEYTI
jgi:hypothetical protein